MQPKSRRAPIRAEVKFRDPGIAVRSGCRRITASLNRRGIECSVGLVADLMRALGLAAVQPRAYKRTTVPVGGSSRFPVNHGEP
jgi:hypothetical protein